MNIVSIGSVELDPASVKIIIPIMPTTEEEVAGALAKIDPAVADLVEWRVDHFQQALDQVACLDLAAQVREQSSLPILATFRTAAEGGETAISDQDYRDLNIALINSGFVDAVDVELFRGQEVFRAIVDAARTTSCVVVASNHDFNATPPREEIVARLGQMEELGADVLKIACMPNSVDDVLTLFAATNEARNTFSHPLITMSMGTTGVLSRVVGATFGSSATFATTGQASAPGQVLAADLQPVLEQLKKWA